MNLILGGRVGHPFCQMPPYGKVQFRGHPLALPPCKGKGLNYYYLIKKKVNIDSLRSKNNVGGVLNYVYFVHTLFFIDNFQGLTKSIVYFFLLC